MKEKKQKMLITAIHIITRQKVELEFYSIKQAKYFNPYLTDFEVVGYVNKE
jgi:hypothetical protein